MGLEVGGFRVGLPAPGVRTCVAGLPPTTPAPSPALLGGSDLLLQRRLEGILEGVAVRMDGGTGRVHVGKQQVD